MKKYEENGIWGVITWNKIVKVSLQVYLWVALFIWINCCSVLFGYDQTITDVAKTFRFVGGAFTYLFFVISCLWLYSEFFLTYLDLDIEGSTKKKRYRSFALKWFGLVVLICVGHYLSTGLPFSLMTS